MRPIQQVIEDFEAFVITPDYMERLYSLTDEVRSNKDGALAMEAMLRVIEKNPDVDLGSPGPLVHAIEIFYTKGYEEELLKSLGRKPTSLSVWMLNRIINGSRGATKERYLGMLKLIADSGNVEVTVRETARRYMEYQTKNM